MKKHLYGLVLFIVLVIYATGTGFVEITNGLPVADENYSIEIEKSKYKLNLLNGDGAIIKEYDVVFGPDPVNDKLREGDGCTPEGRFVVKSKYPHKSWSKFIWLDYPTADSWKKHKTAKSSGKIKSTARIGGEIGIHGVPEGKDYLIVKKINWTLGCISLKNADVNELYKYIKTGTIVHIKH